MYVHMYIASHVEQHVVQMSVYNLDACASEKFLLYSVLYKYCWLVFEREEAL